jgi:hypothetical protein
MIDFYLDNRFKNEDKDNVGLAYICRELGFATFANVAKEYRGKHYGKVIHFLISRSGFHEAKLVAVNNNDNEWFKTIVIRQDNLTRKHLDTMSKNPKPVKMDEFESNVNRFIAQNNLTTRNTIVLTFRVKRMVYDSKTSFYNTEIKTLSVTSIADYSSLIQKVELVCKFEDIICGILEHKDAVRTM